MRCAGIIGCSVALTALAYGQAPTATLGQTGVPPKVSYAIHNDSSVPITAYIVMPKSGRAGGGSEIVDGFMLAKGAVAPGGQADVFSFDRIVTALFADGSVWGDAEWAKLLKLRRQYQFEVLGDAIADLEAGVRSHDPGLTETMNAVRKKRKRQAAELAGERSSADLFEEGTAERKAANIQALASEWRVTVVDMAYGDIVHSLENRPPEKGGDVAEAERVRRLLDQFDHTRRQLIAVQPELH